MILVHKQLRQKLYHHKIYEFVNSLNKEKKKKNKNDNKNN